MYNYQIVAIFIFLCFHMYEILVHSFCREHGDRNSISGCASKLIFPTAATCFLVIWDFASLFFVCEFWRFIITYHGENLKFCSKYWPTSVTVAAKFQAVIPCRSCASNTFSSHPWGNKGTCYGSPFGHWSSYAPKGVEWITIHDWCLLCDLRGAYWDL